jgi:hypothetical protein
MKKSRSGKSPADPRDKSIGTPGRFPSTTPNYTDRKNQNSLSHILFFSGLDTFSRFNDNDKQL